MQKEVFLAILIGLVMGLFITFGVYQARQSNDQEAAIDVQELEQELEPTSSIEKTGKLAVYNPEDESVVDESTIRVTGKIEAKDYIVIYVNDKPYITQADETGNFSQEVELDQSSNIITIHSINEDGEKYELTKTVIVHPKPLITTQPEAEKASASAKTETKSN
ncbi:MAG: hypothetical protein U9O78_03145 [Patescibacteria group bacterium]|nr:hypothetical protein [Patescibacteria group bacterium]